MIKTKTLLLLSRPSFILLVGFTLLLTMISFFFYKHIQAFEDMHERTEIIYEHPLKVSNTALLAKLEVYKMFRTMKDVVLSDDNSDLQALSEKVDTNEKQVYIYLNIIAKKILGNEGRLLTAQTQRLFSQWKAIRSHVFTLKKKRESKKAIAITKNEGAQHVHKLDIQMHKLYTYAQDKAKKIVSTSDQRFTQVENSHQSSFIIFILLSIAISLIIIQRIHKISSRLHSLKERYEYAIIGTDDGLWDWNLKDNSIYLSPKWKEMLGYLDEELENSFEIWKDHVHPDDLEKATLAIENNIDKKTELYENIHRLRHKDGSWVWILDRGKTYFTSQGTPYRMVGFHTNITKQKELEAELLQKEHALMIQSRHAAMGEMVGMIAHQWRQPISVISMDVNNLLADVELESINDDSVVKHSKSILQQTFYLSQTINNFRDFFKKNKRKTDISIATVIDNTISLLSASFDSHFIRVDVNYKFTQECLVLVQELQQVLINIFHNAKEAILEENNHEAHEIHVELFKEEDNIIIAISNKGQLIPEDMLESIFDPYVSTKLEKNGTGLGLYISKTIINQHLHGSLWVENQTKGVCFFIKFPYIKAEDA